MTLLVQAVGRLPIHVTERLEKDRWAVRFISDRDRDYGRQQGARGIHSNNLPATRCRPLARGKSSVQAAARAVVPCPNG